jgi:hypothetical protein
VNSALRTLGALLALVATAAIVTPVANAATRQQAQTKARQAANHYTNSHFGIGFAAADGWRHWSASCTRRSSSAGWSCSVRMEGGQCHGTLKLSRALRPFAHRIGCLE